MLLAFYSACSVSPITLDDAYIKIFGRQTQIAQPIPIRASIPIKKRTERSRPLPPPPSYKHKNSRHIAPKNALPLFPLPSKGETSPSDP
ncbi:hypothetical protein M440DRAFT_1399102 [Trichoderma longibrachiatum ATCC 18648]|uniref:Uncharacterized protein n=1 Tax=Trichoderma longibrachiatum ATCC 18648 TaxID=983965 RepID=A0A2T4CDZ8_TRILO|nr:hypothetical protein M440DRAFT_1399102 [Trichoderma longibrachiatum ATCC 18648]